MKLFSTVPGLMFVPLVVSASLSTSGSFSPLSSFSGSHALSPTKVQSVVERVASTGERKVADRAGELLIQRRLRIERLLISLDRAASVAIQMHPQNSQRLEPVIVDLAEQTLNLVGSSEIQNVKTDSELDRLETTVGELMSAMNKMIEPEMSL